jgi:[ribosomal protein S18]-alanine N-acetyltransferase
MSGRIQDPLMRLRTMGESDLGAVLEVERRAYEFPWSPGIFSDSLRVGYRCWLIERVGAVLGYGIMSVAAREA